MTTPLTVRLREATRALHTEVERSALMHRLLRGELPRDAYCALLRQLHPLYQALEGGLRTAAGRGAPGWLVEPALYRSAALARDLGVLHGPGWEAALPLQPAAAAYAQHLHALAAGRPLLLVAHAYVRYLGDLSGGQALARVLARGLRLDGGAGLAFYDFGGPAAVAALQAQLRSGLDLLAPAEADTQALVAEAVAAFERHRELFAQLNG